MMHHALALLAGVLTLVAVPSLAAAQACRGVPIGAGQIGIAGGISFPKDAKAYGGAIHISSGTPLVVSAGYTLEKSDLIDASANHFHGTAAVEIPDLAFSFCPVFGASYGLFSDDFNGLLASELEVSTLSFAAGFGIGAELPAGPVLSFVPFAVPQFIWTRATASNAGESASESTTEVGGTFGLLLAGDYLFAGPSVSFSTAEDSEPVFSVGVGIRAFLPEPDSVAYTPRPPEPPADLDTEPESIGQADFARWLAGGWMLGLLSWGMISSDLVP